MPGVGEKPVFPIEACGVHRQSHTGKGTWLQSSGHCAQAVATSWASLRCSGIFLLSFLWLQSQSQQNISENLKWKKGITGRFKIKMQTGARDPTSPKVLSDFHTLVLRICSYKYMLIYKRILVSKSIDK